MPIKPYNLKNYLYNLKKTKFAFSAVGIASLMVEVLIWPGSGGACL